MQELGVRPELEIYDSGHLDATLRLRDEGLLGERLQLSLVLGVRGGMAATVENLVSMAHRIPDDAVWQIIAIGRANLKLTAVGMALGGNARAGLEDTLHLRRGELSRGSTPLVARAVELARALDLPVASVQQTRADLDLDA
jgi:3-keto-5-aminohexanoate cleavage enzyme